uniref:RNA helicase n=1 Tax=viral metagenome TaxID=1070528 RepID=A0A6C0I4E4_9ZZZZ
MSNDNVTTPTDTINASEHVPPAFIIEENSNYKHVMYERWDHFDFKMDLLRGIYAMGFENPSDIQKRGIHPIISGQDVIAQAQSGSGKTGTFSISALQSVDVEKKELQAIIIAPTHELVKQITKVIETLGSFMEGLRIKTILGGTSIQQDAAELRERPPHIIVGCAGRIYDMVRRRHLDLSTMKLFILDEADEMLSMGFKDQIYNIFQNFPETIQVALFSATLPDDILELTKKFMRDPVKITMKKEDLKLDCIDQRFIALANDGMKYDTLKDLFAFISLSQCIIYCNSVKRVNDLYQAMVSEGFSVCAIHSSMDKVERDSVFAGFRGGAHRVLISSNVTARGIDVQQVSTVINFDIPKCVHTYLHRIGRSGRWGRKGLAINFVTRQDVHLLKKIEEHYQSNISELTMDAMK